MLSSSPSPPNHPKDKSSRKKDRLPKVRRGRNTQYKFVQTNPRAYNSDQLRGFAPNVSLSDTRPRRGIRRFQPTGGPHLEPSLLPIISACSEYPGPIEFVIEVFPKETTSALDELVPTPPSPPPVESIPPPAPPPAPPPTPPPTPACNSDLLDLWGKELPTLQSHCTLCNEKFPEGPGCEWHCPVCDLGYRTTTDPAKPAFISPGIGTTAQPFQYSDWTLMGTPSTAHY